MNKQLLASTLLVTLLATACTPTQKKVGAGTLAAGSVGLAAAGVSAFVQAECPSDPYESCDTKGFVQSLGLISFLGAAVLATGATLLYLDAKSDEREAEKAAPAPAAQATLG